MVTEPAEAKRILISITYNYLYKIYFHIRNQETGIYQKLVRALALQLGNEVPYNKVSNLLYVEKGRAKTYIDLWEILCTIQIGFVQHKFVK